MKIVYTAGPFTGPTPWVVECNVMEMRKIALVVANLGAMPLCPHANTSFFVDQCTPEFWYKGTLELLKRCDAIIMHPNWRASTGSRGEHRYAEKHGMPIFYYGIDGLIVDGAKFHEWVADEK